MKKIPGTLAALLPLFLCAIVTDAAAQTATKPDNFLNMRKNNFTQLLGINQEGFKLNYNSEKTNIEGTAGGEIKKSHLFLLGGASAGTTTDLSALFSQKVLPAFSVNMSAHWFIKSMSTWYYDEQYNKLFDVLKNGKGNSGDLDIQKSTYKYTDKLGERVQEGILKATETLYTFKTFYWLSFTGKYDNNKYSFYDGSRTFASQLYEPAYNSWTGKVTANAYYYWNKTDIKWLSKVGWRPNFIYFNIAAQYGLGNNIQQLKKTTVNDITSSVVEGGTTRQVVKSHSAYTGTYKEFKTIKPSFEFVLSPIRSVAVNVFGEYNIINGSDRDRLNIDNYGSIATGLYFYGNGNSSKINIGAYYKWTRDNADDSWKGQIGLKTSIPITPLQ